MGAVLLCLPSSLPDFNPIEHSFRTLKCRRSDYPHLSIDELVVMYC